MSILMLKYAGKDGFKMNEIRNSKKSAYIGLFFVVFVWGLAPQITLELTKLYSPALRVAMTELILLISYLTLSAKHFKEFNLSYIKVGLITGLFLSLANLTQKIGLPMSTPSKYSFLENLSIISVPLLTYLITKKKPGKFTYIACGLCLLGVFVLNGVSFDDGWGLGEILCALAGIFYGVNIAITGIYAKGFYVPLYLAVQSTVGLTFASIVTFILNTLTGPSGEPLEAIHYSHDPMMLLLLIVYIIISNAFCWIIRTNALKHINATAVTIIMPLSAVITAVVSVLCGTDTVNLNLLGGGIMIIGAVILSSMDK